MFQEAERLINIIGIPSLMLGFLYIGRKLQILDQVQESIRSINQSIEMLKHNVKVICDHLINKDDGFDHTLVKHYSPLNLKIEAMHLLKKIDFIEVFHQNKSDFFALIESEKPNTKFDVELQSTKAVFILFEKSYFKGVKNYLYNNPTVEYRKFGQVLGIYVRDRYLEAHPEI